METVTAQEGEPRGCVIDKDLEGSGETELEKDVREGSRNVEMVNVESRSRSEFSAMVHASGLTWLPLYSHFNCNCHRHLTLATCCSLGDHSNRPQ
jgi:hypothetical protein